MSRKTKKRNKLHVKKGDMVHVTAGNDRGAEGKILKVFPKKNRVIVEGVNLRTRHVKPNQAHPQGARLEQEVSIHVSNVMPLDSNGVPTRVGRKRIEDPETGRGRWVRVAKTTGEELG